MLVICRFIQGLVAGPVIPLSQSLLIREGTPESRNKDLAIWSTIVITAPVVGPILGGYISDWYNWSWIFYINIPMGLFCAAALWTLLRHRESDIEKIPGDVLGIILLVIGVSCLQIFLDKGQEWDWFNSNKIRLLIIGTIMAFTYLIIREKWYKMPLLNLRLFSIPSFTISIICLSISYAIYFGTVVLVPLWLQEYMDYTAEWAGFAVCALGIGPIFLTMVSPRLINKFGYLLTLMASFVIFGIGCFLTTFFTTDIDLYHIALTRFIFGLGFVCYIGPLISMSVQHIAAQDLPNATGIFHFFRSMFGGIGTSVFTTLWLRRTYFHHERIGANLTPFNPVTPQAADQASLAQLNNSLDKQAAILALNDAFYLMGWLFVGLVVLLLIWHFWTKKGRERTHRPEVPTIHH
jgi:DHA2 family multidrug resistance protein